MIEAQFSAARDSVELKWKLKEDGLSQLIGQAKLWATPQPQVILTRILLSVLADNKVMAAECEFLMERIDETTMATSKLRELGELPRMRSELVERVGHVCRIADYWSWIDVLCSINRLIDWSIHSFIHSFSAHRLIDWLIDLFVQWSTVRLIDWLINVRSLYFSVFFFQCTDVLNEAKEKNRSSWDTTVWFSAVKFLKLLMLVMDLLYFDFLNCMPIKSVGKMGPKLAKGGSIWRPSLWPFFFSSFYTGREWSWHFTRNKRTYWYILLLLTCILVSPRCRLR